MRRRVLLTPPGWLKRLVALCLLGSLGCGSPPAPLPPADITYTFDDHTQKIIRLLAEESEVNPYKDFDRRFTGLFVPPSLFSLEPFVLGLSTESYIPTILLLEAHWVKRYGEAGWLQELERSQIKFPKNSLVPAVAEAFTVSPAGTSSGRPGELMAAPASIRGNILFYRRDLLDRYGLRAPRHWDELKAICRQVMPRERRLKYGLLLDPTRFGNDFYSIFWGFGGRVMDRDRFVLAEPENQAAFLAALKEIQGMQGSILPAAGHLRRFEAEGATLQSFCQGEALFMIASNNCMQDLGNFLGGTRQQVPGGLTHIRQVGVAPIPSQVRHPRRYTNLESFGWAVNIVPATGWNALNVIDGVRQFLKLVVNEAFQLQAAETWGEVPSLRGALEKMQNPQVLQVYNDVFAVKDLVIRVRPHRPQVNVILSRRLKEVLDGGRSPEAVLQEVLQDLERLASAG